MSLVEKIVNNPLGQMHSLKDAQFLQLMSEESNPYVSFCL